MKGRLFKRSLAMAIVAAVFGVMLVARAQAEIKIVPADWNPPAVSTARALQLFETICGGSLPKFAKAKKLMAANGIYLASKQGSATVFSKVENVSFQIQTYSDGNGRCSMVFKTKESRKALRQSFKSLGPTEEVMGNLSVAYRDRTVAVLEEGDDQLHRFFMLSEVTP